MAKENVVSETFGGYAKQPTVSRGKITTIGHMVDERQFDDRKVFSVNQKTGVIQKSNKAGR